DEQRTARVLGPDGRVGTTTLRLSALGSLTLTAQGDFAKKLPLLAAVRGLGAEQFRERQRAQAELMRMGAEIRPDLEACLESAEDPEVRARLRGLLERLPADPSRAARAAVPFDLLTHRRAVWGHLGEEGIPVRVGGRT